MPCSACQVCACLRALLPVWQHRRFSLGAVLPALPGNVAEAKTRASCLLWRRSLGCALWACTCRGTPMHRQLASQRAFAGQWQGRSAIPGPVAQQQRGLWAGTRSTCLATTWAQGSCCLSRRRLESVPYSIPDASRYAPSPFSQGALHVGRASSLRIACLSAVHGKGAAGIAVVQRAAAACRSALTSRSSSCHGRRCTMPGARLGTVACGSRPHASQAPSGAIHGALQAL